MVKAKFFEHTVRVYIDKDTISENIYYFKRKSLTAKELKRIEELTGGKVVENEVKEVLFAMEDNDFLSNANLVDTDIEEDNNNV